MLRVPSLVYNLISESVLDKEGKWIVGGNGQRVYYERSSGGAIDYARVFLTATLNSTGLYIANPMYLGLKNRKYSLPLDALRTITVREDMHLLSPDWLDGHGPPPYASRPPPPHVPPPEDNDDDNDDDDGDGRGSRRRGDGRHGDDGNDDEPGSDGCNSNGKPFFFLNKP